MTEEIEQLLQQFIDNVIINKTACFYDSDQANEANKKLNEAYVAITKKGQVGITSFMKLLHHEDERIRLVAAALALHLDEKKALIVLEELKKNEGLIALNAKHAIMHWEMTKNNPSRN